MNGSDVLVEENAQLRDSLAESERERKRLQNLNDQLRQRIDELSRRIFGRSSEKLNKCQLDYLLDHFKEPDEKPTPEEPDPTTPPGPKKRRAKAQIKVPDDLEVVEEVLIPDEVKLAPELWRKIDQEVLEQIDYIPGRFLRLLTIRPKYVRIDNREEAPIIVPAPVRLIDRGIATTRLLTYLIISKFVDHLPCYRLEKMFLERHCVHIPRQQIAQWIGKCANELEFIYNLIREEVLSAKYLQVDETPIQFLDKTTPRGSAKGYFWTYYVPGLAAVFDWQTSRSTDGLRKFLGKSFHGKIQCDGYAAYDTYAKEASSVKLIGCWAHTRRKFENARNQDRETADTVLLEIQKLYRIEKELRESEAKPEERLKIRKEKSEPIARGLHTHLKELATQLRPASGLGKAVSYALGQWPKLKAVFEHGEAELDTNLVENQIRPSAVGKKNWLFIGHRDAGKRAAIFYTLIQTCRMHRIEPSAYLRDVLGRLPTATNQTAHELTPRAWAAAQKSRS